MFGFLYSVLAYVGFLGCFSYFVFFTDGVLVPKHVDSGQPGSLAAALAINLGLILLWGAQHSVMAREGFKRWLTRLIPAALERSTFVLASVAALCILMYGWQPLPGELWSVESPALVAALWGVNALGWAGVPVVSFLIDHFDLFGLKQPFMRWRKQSYEKKGFVLPLFYRYVRHPMMTAMLVAFWATPHMSVGHLLLSLGLSAYIAVGVHFEERSLARELGRPYRDYQKQVPKFLPGPSALAAGPRSGSRARIIREGVR